MAERLFAQALPAVTAFTSPRAWAFSLIGIHEYLRRVKGGRIAKDVRQELMARLVALFDRVAEPGWTWFEEGLTYDNAKLAHALIVSGRATGQKSVCERGLDALKWLVGQQTSQRGQLQPIGSNGFYKRNGHAGDLRPTAHRGPHHGLGVPGGISLDSRPMVVRTGPAGLRLVPRLERSRAGTLRPRDGRLPRRAAPGQEQRKPGGGIHAGLPPVAGGNAADTEHRARRSTGRSGGLHHVMNPIDVKRSTVTLDPDRTHVLARPFRLDERRALQ